MNKLTPKEIIKRKEEVDKLVLEIMRADEDALFGLLWNLLDWKGQMYLLGLMRHHGRIYL